MDIIKTKNYKSAAQNKIEIWTKHKQIPYVCSNPLYIALSSFPLKNAWETAADLSGLHLCATGVMGKYTHMRAVEVQHAKLWHDEEGESVEH